MKTAKQLFVDFESDDYPACITEESFYDALTEHDLEIVDKIDEIKRKDILDDPFKDGWNQALTELKQYIKEQR